MFILCTIAIGLGNPPAPEQCLCGYHRIRQCIVEQIMRFMRKTHKSHFFVVVVFLNDYRIFQPWFRKKNCLYSHFMV